MKFYKKIKQLFNAKEQRQVLYLLIGILAMSLLEVVGIASIAPFMAVVTKPEMIHTNHYLNSAYHYFGFTSDKKFLLGSGVFVLVMLTITNGYNAFMNWRITYFSKMQGYHLARRLLAQYLFQPYLFFLNRNTADLGKNILSEVSRVINSIVLVGMLTISKLVGAVFIVGFLVLVDPFLAISAAGVLSGAYWLIYKLVHHRLHRLGHASTRLIFQRFQITNEAMAGIKDIKLHGSEAEFLRRFSIPSEENANNEAQSTAIVQLPKYALETLAFGGIVIIVLYLIGNDHNSGHVIPLIALYALAGYRLMPALQQVYQGISSVKYNFPALEILVDDLAGYKGDEFFHEPQQPALPFEQSLKLESVCFYYPDFDIPIIDNLNLHILPNTTVGLVGTTGSGKTTLVDILLGLLAPKSGSLLVDGVRITKENLSMWQKNLGYVPQSIYLTDDTIERNIAFAIPDDEIDFERVVQAAKLAELDDFVRTLPDRYQTEVGDHGVRLSGGQRQRIGIARALYSNPKVLVLDEATSALDGITENVIMEAINNFSHQKTVVIIAHRLATVKGCDVIHLMDKGRIAGSGSYDELIQNNLQFRKMAQQV